MISKKFIVLFAFLFLLHTAVLSQNVISGIVVDSISLTSLSGAHIKIKNTDRGTVTATNGSFAIKASDFDTLIFTQVGYHTLYYPLLGPETDILIRMSEAVRMLREVTTTAKSKTEIMEKKPPRYTKSDGSYVRSISLAEGISSPFTYFSSWEREKRKVLKMREENKKIKTYVDVVNNPEIKNEIMKKYSLPEKDYYEILAKFNNENRQAAYLTNPEDIKRLLFNYYDKILRQ